MSTNEERRYALHRKLDEVLGPEHAATMMEIVPPVGWADVATKHDLGELERRLDLRFEAMEHKVMSALHQELSRFDERLSRFDERLSRFDERFHGLTERGHRDFRTLVFAMIGTQLTAVSLAFAAARF